MNMMYIVLFNYEFGDPYETEKYTSLIGCEFTKDKAIEFCDNAKLGWSESLKVYEVPIGLPSKFNGCEDYPVVYRKDADLADLYEYQDFVKEEVKVVKAKDGWEVIDEHTFHKSTFEEAMELAKLRLEAFLQMYIGKEGYIYAIDIDDHDPNFILVTGTCKKED